MQLKILDPRIGREKPLPAYQSAAAAGIDLYACVKEPTILEPNSCILIPSGIALYMKNPQICGIIAPRSGLGHKHGIILGNNIGIIDADYQGEIRISCWNRSTEAYTITPLERIAQLLFVPIARVPQFTVVDEFSEAEERDTTGFGSSGK